MRQASFRSPSEESAVVNHFKRLFLIVARSLVVEASGFAGLCSVEMPWHNADRADESESAMGVGEAVDKFSSIYQSGETMRKL